MLNLTGNPSQRLVKLDPSQPGLATNSAVKHVLHQVLARYPLPSDPAVSVRNPVRPQDRKTGSDGQIEVRSTPRTKRAGEVIRGPSANRPNDPSADRPNDPPADRRDDPLSPVAASDSSNDTSRSETPDTSVADHAEVDAAPYDLMTFLGKNAAPVRSA